MKLNTVNRYGRVWNILLLYLIARLPYIICFFHKMIECWNACSVILHHGVWNVWNTILHKHIGTVPKIQHVNVFAWVVINDAVTWQKALVLIWSANFSQVALRSHSWWASRGQVEISGAYHGVVHAWYVDSLSTHPLASSPGKAWAEKGHILSSAAWPSLWRSWTKIVS